MLNRFQREKPTEPAEQTKLFYWRNHGMVVLQIDDPNLRWDQREIGKQIMVRRYGERREAGSKHEAKR